MLLAEAIAVAARFVGKGKAPAILQALRLIPSCSGQPARLYATDGYVGVIVTVGQELPNMVLPVEQLTKIRRDVVGISHVEDQGNAVAVIRVMGKNKKAATYTLKGMAPSEFPGFPAIPENFTALHPFHWETIRKVVHAVGKDVSKPELMNLNFRPTAVEATDHHRVARAEVTGNWGGLVPARLFQNCARAYNVEYAFTGSHCFWRMRKDELRFAALQVFPNYPDLEKIIPEEHQGWSMTVEVKCLLEMVKKAADMSPTASVVLDFGLMGVTVKAYAKRGVAFEGPVPGVMSLPWGENARYVTLMLDGKYFVQALKAVITPRVRLCYGQPDDPVRIESGGLIECLWPMLVPSLEQHHEI
jgi:DNA polymerase III sliding clamp (beta) subunit (PCNA family)